MKPVKKRAKKLVSAIDTCRLEELLRKQRQQVADAILRQQKALIEAVVSESLREADADEAPAVALTRVNRRWLLAQAEWLRERSDVLDARPGYSHIQQRHTFSLYTRYGRAEDVVIHDRARFDALLSVFGIVRS